MDASLDNAAMPRNNRILFIEREPNNNKNIKYKNITCGLKSRFSLLKKNSIIYIVNASLDNAAMPRNNRILFIEREPNNNKNIKYKNITCGLKSRFSLLKKNSIIYIVNASLDNATKSRNNRIIFIEREPNNNKNIKY